MAPLLRLLPRRRLEAIEASGSLEGTAVAFDPDDGAPGLPDWECVPTPGHTPGHVALFRPADGVVISGDAALTVNLNSVSGFLRATPELSGPPRYTTWDWARARESVVALAARQPQVLAPGHGGPMQLSGGRELRALAEGMGRRDRKRRPSTGREP